MMSTPSGKLIRKYLWHRTLDWNVKLVISMDSVSRCIICRFFPLESVDGHKLTQGRDYQIYQPRYHRHARN